jgi:hypothetical protein
LAIGTAISRPWLPSPDLRRLGNNALRRYIIASD